MWVVTFRTISTGMPLKLYLGSGLGKGSSYVKFLGARPGCGWCTICLSTAHVSNANRISMYDCVSCIYISQCSAPCNLTPTCRLNVDCGQNVQVIFEKTPRPADLLMRAKTFGPIVSKTMQTWIVAIKCIAYLLLPTDAVCCPDIYIENVVLLNIWQLGEIAENTACTQCFPV